jgi:uncharacterized PurR-regulated membrane protein YhhQ (DUF165 family)
VGCIVRALGVGGAAKRNIRGAARLAAGVDDAGLYRLRSASDAAWPGTVAYRRRDTIWHRTGAFFSGIARLFLPVLLLVSAIAAIYLYLDAKLTVLPGGGWLTVSHALVPAAFFVIALTNRRYGPSYAFMQVVLACLAAFATATFAPDAFRGLLPAHVEPGIRVAGAFGVSFFLASFISIIVFDGARGPRWWAAPLLGALSSALVFCSVFYAAAYGGTEYPWVHQMLVYMALMTGASVFLLLPYWLLRGLVPPLPGYGGY